VKERRELITLPVLINKLGRSVFPITNNYYVYQIVVQEEAVDRHYTEVKNISNQEQLSLDRLSPFNR
jgi:hypothetical protein